MGRNEKIFRSISEKVKFLESFGHEVSYSISLNEEPNHQNYPSIIETLEQNPYLYKQEQFHDSVENHTYSILANLELHVPKSVDWVWPLPEDETWDFGNFSDLDAVLRDNSCKLIYVNQKYTLSQTKPDENRFFIDDKRYAALEVFSLNAGIDGLAKLGGWIFRPKAYDAEDISMWSEWLTRTTIFTHSFFFLVLSRRVGTNGIFVNAPLIVLEENETDIDLSPSWKIWYEKKGRPFQFDWTLGQLLIFKDLVARKVLNLDEISSMLITYSPRGVVSQIYDIQWRLHLAMLRIVLDSDTKFSPKELRSALDFLGSLRNQNLVYLRHLENVLTVDKSSSRSRLFSLKYCIFFWDVYSQDQIFPLLIGQSGIVKYYKRKTSTVLFYENQIKAYSEKESFKRDLRGFYILRDASEDGVISRVNNAEIMSPLISDESFPMRFEEWYLQIMSQFKPNLRLPKIQLLFIRHKSFRSIRAVLIRIKTLLET
jgi:hypothetical protein